MFAFTTDRPAQARGARGKWTAFVLALVVNLLFVGVLVFSVSWQNRKPEAVTAELYAPPPPVSKPPVLQPIPQPKVQPPPSLAPTPKLPPVVEKPDEQEAEIALRAKKEAERRAKEQAEREREQREAAQREQARRDAEAKRQAEEKREAEQRAREAEAKRQAEQKRQAEERQARAVEAMRAQAEREARLRVQAERESQLRAQADRELRMRAEAEQEARERAAQAAAGAARNRAQLDWIDKIRSRIRGYIILPPDIPGNPEAIFDVVQLPTGEIIDVKLRKSSGVRAYDEAVQRAILKASPLPKPVPADLFQRNLELRFRPLDQ
jgi:colicin import membrane protein